MESSKFTETQSATSNSRNTASNTSPIACGCCGSKGFAQSVSAHCCRPPYMGPPKCKHSQSGSEEDYPIPYQFFPSFPVFHPLFYGNPIPGGFCCSFYNPNTKKPTKHTPNEEDPKYYCEKDRPKHYETNSDAPENAVYGPESHYSRHSMYSTTESSFNGFFQQCACGDSMPWTYSPVMTPVIPYCFLWNAPKINPNLSAHMSSNEVLHEMKVKNSENSRNSYNEPIDMYVDVNNNATGVKTDVQDVEFDQNTKNSGNSSSFLSLKSVNFGDRIQGGAEKEEGNKCTNENVTYEEEDIEGVIQQVESIECLNLSDKNESYDSNYCYTTELDPSKDTDSYLVDSQSCNELKIEISNANSNTDVISSNQDGSEDEEEEENIFMSPKERDSGVNNGDDIYVTDTPHLEERAPCKKLIKNFTLTDQVSDTGTLDGSAAGGDLGGSNCNGYKIYINPEERYNNNEEEGPKEKLSSTEFILLELKESDENKPNEKNPESGRSTKSAIAKPSNTPKPKETTKNNVTGITKRKHYCLNTEMSTANVNHLKIQKTKNHTFGLHQIIGSEKANEINNKNQKIQKKDGRSLTAKIEVGGANKSVKTVSKKWEI